ncbi:SAM-dependent methyltransferase [Streptomyces sp. NRRL WC-3742]|uniref:SAM-dependent methyltransferase n=1 Tax=Streptomyces sp. NRRL WC-3742 TaxID=1463934 RepID=UPI00068D35E8|nr:SAM-dependent methyltransferase [Streptomyces sp. NRRL WC-3742]
MTAERDGDEGTATAPDVEINLAINRPHSARMYDYFLGGVTNFAPDREAAAQALSVFPQARHAARANRAFMRRATRALARSGITQFLDIGTGIPTSPNLHEVAQGVEPGSRVVYADNDPIVLTHAQALLRSAPEGRTAYVQADVREPAAVLEAVRETGVLDFTRPIALSLVALLHFVPDGAHEITETFKDALTARGSALVISHLTPEYSPEETERICQVYAVAGNPVRARTPGEFAGFFAGWDLLDPGVVSTPRWRPEPGDEAFTDAEAACLGAIAVRP